MLEHLVLAQEQVLRARLRREACSPPALVCEVLGHLGMADVGHDGPGAGAAHQQRGDHSRHDLRVAAPPLRDDAAVLTALGAQELRGGLGERLVLTVDQAHRVHLGGGAEVPLTRGRVMPRYAVRGAGEHLEEGRAGRLQRSYLVGAVRPGVRGQAEIHVGPAGEVPDLRAEVVRGTHGVSVCVFDDRGGAGSRRGARAVREILPIGAAGIHEVDVGVDPAGQEEPGRVHRLAR